MIDNKQIGMDINIIQQLHNRTHIKNTYLRLAGARSTARAYVTLKRRVASANTNIPRVLYSQDKLAV